MARYNETTIGGVNTPSVAPVQTQQTKEIDTLASDIEKLTGGLQKGNEAIYKASEYATTLAAIDTDYNTKLGFQEIYNQTVGAKLAQGLEPTSEDYKTMIDWRTRYLKDVTQQVASEDDTDNLIYKEKFFKPSYNTLAELNQQDTVRYQNARMKESIEEFDAIVGNIKGTTAPMTVDSVNIRADLLGKKGVGNHIDLAWNKVKDNRVNNFMILNDEIIKTAMQNGTVDKLLKQYFGEYIYYDKEGNLVNHKGVADNAAKAMKDAWTSKLSQAMKETTSKVISYEKRDMPVSSGTNAIQTAISQELGFQQEALALEQQGYIKVGNKNKTKMSDSNSILASKYEQANIYNSYVYSIRNGDYTNADKFDADSTIKYEYMNYELKANKGDSYIFSKDDKRKMLQNSVTDSENILQSPTSEPKDRDKAIKGIANIYKGTGVSSPYISGLSKNIESNGVLMGNTIAEQKAGFTTLASYNKEAGISKTSWINNQNSLLIMTEFDQAQKVIDAEEDPQKKLKLEQEAKVKMSALINVVKRNYERDKNSAISKGGIRKFVAENTDLVNWVFGDSTVTNATLAVIESDFQSKYGGTPFTEDNVKEYFGEHTVKMSNDWILNNGQRIIKPTGYEGQSTKDMVDRIEADFREVMKGTKYADFDLEDTNISLNSYTDDNGEISTVVILRKEGSMEILDTITYSGSELVRGIKKKKPENTDFEEVHTFG